MQQPKAAFSAAAERPLQQPLIPSFSLMQRQEETRLARMLPCWCKACSRRGGSIRAILMFSKGCRHTEIVTPLTIPYIPFSLIISTLYQQLPQPLPSRPETQSPKHPASQYPSLNPPGFILFMNQRRSQLLVRHFLKNSPATQLRQYQTLFADFHPDKKAQYSIPTDPTYVQNFLRSVEVFGTPLSMIKAHRDLNLFDMRKMFGQDKLHCRPYHSPESEAEQVLQCVRDMSNLSRVSLAQYQEAEQRIVIAKPETISQVKMKLVYLFKILINKRDKHPLESLELEANISLSEAIIRIFAKQAQQGLDDKEWRELQAMQKLMLAIEHKKNGQHQMATHSFEEIFRDEAAANQTRLEALKILCEEGEELGDASFLEPLVSLAQEKGEKQYEKHLKLTIKRIKAASQRKAAND